MYLLRLENMHIYEALAHMSKVIVFNSKIYEVQCNFLSHTTTNHVNIVQIGGPKKEKKKETKISR